MKRATVLLSLAIIGIVALAVFRKPDERILFEDFRWTVQGKAARVTFRVTNQTDQHLTTIVSLLADHVSEGRDGAKLHPIGWTRIDVPLNPLEEKKVEAIVELTRFGTSATVVSYSITIEEPNKAPEPTLGIVRFSQGSEIFNLVAGVAHL